MTHAVPRKDAPGGPAWLTLMAGVVLAGAIATLALSARGSETPATTEQVAIDVPPPAQPSGIITYGITGRGYFTARATGEPIGAATEHDLHGVHNAVPEGRVLTPDGSRSARVERNDTGAFLAVGPPGAEQVITQLAGPSDPALVAGGKGAARAVAGVPLVVAWSPDSKQLAYGSITGEPWTLQIMASGAVPQITTREVRGGYVGELAWSPDGRYLAISTYQLDRKNHTVLMYDRNTGSLNRVIDGCHLTWSPDSRYLAIHRDPGPDGGAWVISPDGETRIALTRDPAAFPYSWREG